MTDVGMVSIYGWNQNVKRSAKKADPHYKTKAHIKWRAAVLEAATFQCEARNAQGKRCQKAAPHRLFADHIVERSDGGAPFDPANGQCLCGSHHTRKTRAARAAR